MRTRKKLANNLRKIAAALRGMKPLSPASPTKPMTPISLTKPMQPKKLLEAGKTTMGPLGAPQMKQSLKGLPNPTAARSGES